MKSILRKKFPGRIFLVVILIGASLVFYWQINSTKFSATPYQLPDLKFFPRKVNQIEVNRLTVEGIRLGRFLFYDGRLSGSLHPDSLRSCASCHIQQKSFTGEGFQMEKNATELSSDYQSIKTGSHEVLPLINLIYNRNGFFWNGLINDKNTNKGPSKGLRYQSLEDVVWISIESKDCMGGSIDQTVDLISSIELYQPMFKKAFGTEKVSIERIDKAIAQFLRSIIAFRFKLYGVLNGEKKFEPDELRGYELFHSEKAGCFHCHAGSLLMTTNEYYNNGLMMDSLDSRDRFLFTNYLKDKGAYRAPSLINCEITGPYMHDGRYKSLDEVLDFYSEGIQYTDFTDPLIKGAIEGGIKLTRTEKNDLKAFLLTLTDRSILADTSFSAPIELGIYSIRHSSL